MITDLVKGSSVTYTKNPDYWGYDEKYPENRLPYIDQLRALIMPEVATQLAALRTGTVDYMGRLGAAQIRNVDQVESLERTNPELEMWPSGNQSDNGFAMNIQKPPFDDIRVRKAMQMALDRETLHNTYFKGWGSWTPHSLLANDMPVVGTAFEEWPEELKQYYRYDPEAAEKLLDEAGYPRGADGMRFETNLVWLDRGDFDINYAELMVSYWREIGIHVDIDHTPGADYGPSAQDPNVGAHSWVSGVKAFPARQMETFSSGFVWNKVSDAQYDAWYEEMLAAATDEEQMSAIKKMDMYSIEQHWMIWGAMGPAFNVHQPWVIGYNGEGGFGRSRNNDVFARLWIDSELKESTGN
jgi:peptide/nickel transport system substrate-binding protein